MHRGEDAKRQSLLRNILISPLEGEKKFLSELCELRNFREGYKKYKNIDCGTESAMTDFCAKSSGMHRSCICRSALLCRQGKNSYNQLVQHKTELERFEPSPAFVMLTGVRKRLLPLTKREGSDSVISNNFSDTAFSQLTTHHSLKRTAFTLAEVLITLGIIGIVASLTLPSLIQNYKEKEIINKAKKDYSLIMQALQLAQADFGTPNDNSSLFTSVSNANDLTSVFAKYIPNAKLCLSNSKDASCSGLSYNVQLTKYKDRYDVIGRPVLLLPDGGLIAMRLDSSKCVDSVKTGANLDSDGKPIYNEDGTPSQWTGVRNSCGSIAFDVNGVKAPNKFGYDAFRVEVFSNKVNKGYWDVYGGSSLYSILQGGKLKYNKN